MNAPIEIRENQGDIIGVGIDGNGNIIWKNVSIVINELSEDCGLILLSQNHFKENTDTEENFQQWKEKGYSFSLEAVYQGKSFRRERVLNEIKSNLEAKKRLLLLGESGTSKTTLLMEIICDYFNAGYRVLYNLGDDDLKNTNTITEKMKELVYGDNKILVVIDNAHSSKMALIFNVIKNLKSLNKEKKDNMRFLLSARQPEFDWALERNLFQDTNLVQKIKSLFDNDHKIIVKYFEKEEIKEFIEKYLSFINPLLKNKSIQQNTDAIFKDTQGHPIMVRFAVLNEGLSGHIEQMYFEYLQDKNNNNYPAQTKTWRDNL